MAVIPFSERVRFAAKALAGIFSDQTAQAAQEGFIAQIVGTSSPYHTKPSTSALLELFNQSPLLRMVAGRIGHDVASVTWRMLAPTSDRSRKYVIPEIKNCGRREREDKIRFYKQKEAVRNVEQHPMISLLVEGNDYHLGSTIRRLTTIYIDLVGEAFWILERNMAGVPIQAIPIPPSWVIHTPSSDYPFFVISTGQMRLDVPRDEMLWFVDPDISSPYSRGSGIAHTLTDELEIDEYATKHVKSFFANRARPEILITGPSLNKDATIRLEEKWLSKLQGFKRAYLPFFMDAPDGMQMHKLTQDFESMQMVDLRKNERDVIINTWGVSPEVFGIIEESNRSTIDASDFLVAKHVTVPRLEFLREHFQHRLLPLYADTNLIVTYDSPIDEDRDRKLRAARFAPWSMKVDEWRELQGLDPLDRGGDVHMVNASIFPHSSLAEEDFVVPMMEESDARESTESKDNRSF